MKNKNDLKAEFKNIEEMYSCDDSTREKIINLSREINKFAKQAIYAAQRDDLVKSQKLLDEGADKISQASELLNNSNLDNVGSFRACLEEYIEAKCFLHFLKEGVILLRKDLDMNIMPSDETYLQALCDFSGELAKKSTTYAINKKYDEIIIIEEVLVELMELFLEFDFRSGELRKKVEGLKYALSKVQSIRYDIEVKK